MLNDDYGRLQPVAPGHSEMWTFGQNSMESLSMETPIHKIPAKVGSIGLSGFGGNAFAK